MIEATTAIGASPVPRTSVAVTPASPPHGAPFGLAKVLEHLGRVHGTLRRAVADAITRKRAPELAFVPVAPGEAGHE